MPPRNRSGIENAGVNVQAKAEIAASARYEITKTVTEAIPADVTRAKANTWLTILSPITQWSGLKGDQLAHKRELLRIQQEEILARVLQLAAPRLKAISVPIKPVPIKFLVPFLENASLEEPDSELVQLWANLLVSSAENYHADNVFYVGLISRMSSTQARLFANIIGKAGPRETEIRLERINSDFLQDFLISLLEYEFERTQIQIRTITQCWSFLCSILKVDGLLIQHIELVNTKTDTHTNGLPTYSLYSDDKENDLSILNGLGLIKYTDTGFKKVGDRWEVKILAHYVSRLGISFAKACDVKA